MRLIEREVEALNDSVIMSVTVGDYDLLIDFEITHMLLDMKFRNYIMGLGLNNSPCFLCSCTKEDMCDKEKIAAGFTMDRSSLSLELAAEALKYNPDNLPFSDLKKRAAGSKSIPLLKSRLEKCSFDSLHFLLAVGRFIYKIIVHFNAGLLGHWEIVGVIEKEYYQFHEKELQDKLSSTLSIFAKFGVLDGNKCRKLLDINNTEKVLNLLNDDVSEENRNNFRFILNELSYLYAVIGSSNPKENFCMQEFSHRSKSFMLWLVDTYPWFRISTYLHIATSHASEILKTQDSIGLYSTEVTESKHHWSLVYAARNARRNDNLSRMHDVYFRAWMRSCPIVKSKGATTKRRVKKK